MRHQILLGLVIVAVLSTLLLGNGFSIAFAADDMSDVMDDLNHGGDFDPGIYSENSEDYSLSVIQIAESSTGQLLVYVHQPSGQSKDLRAVRITIASEPDSEHGAIEGDYFASKAYSLQYVNSSTVFFKYIVKDFKIKSDSTRYYNIGSISRPYIEGVDSEPENDNKIITKSYPVGQYWRAVTVGDKVNYRMEKTEVVSVTDKLVGRMVYSDGYSFNGWSATEVMTVRSFVAFDTDYRIDELMSARVTYTTVEFTAMLCTSHVHVHEGHGFLNFYHQKPGKVVPNNEAVLYADNVVSNPGGGNIVVGKSFTWKQIQSVSEFLTSLGEQNYTVTQQNQLDISDCKWVLNFYEGLLKTKTDVGWRLISLAYLTSLADTEVYCNSAEAVQILDLEFKTEGRYYHLGVIDNMQIGSVKPFAESEDKGEMADWLKWVIGLGSVLIAVVLLGVLADYIPYFGQILLWLVKGLSWIIFAPIRLLIYAFGGTSPKLKE